MEDLFLNFSISLLNVHYIFIDDTKFNDDGFDCVHAALQEMKKIRKLELVTRILKKFNFKILGKSSCSAKHVVQLANILPAMDTLQYFDLYHDV